MIRVTPSDTPRSTIRALRTALLRKRESAANFAGPNPTRVEQARLETLDNVINDLEQVSYQEKNP